METLTDWIAWFSHFLIGAFLAALVSFNLVSPSRRHYPSDFLIPLPLLPPYLIGAALLGGAIGSHYGDRLWTRREILLLRPEPPPRTPLCVALSLLSGFAGALLLAYAILKTNGFLSF